MKQKKIKCNKCYYNWKKNQKNIKQIQLQRKKNIKYLNKQLENLMKKLKE